MNEYMMKSNDYMALFAIFFKKHGREDSAITEMISFLYTYGYAYNQESGKVQYTPYASHVDAQSQKEWDFFKEELGRKFINIPAIQLTEHIASWINNKREFMLTKRLEQYLTKQNFNLFDMMGDYIANVDSTIVLDQQYTKMIEKSIYSPTTITEIDDLLKITNRLVQSNKKYDQGNALILLNFISGNQSYDREEVKNLISTFMKNNISISNTSINHYTKLKIFWRNEDFTEQIKTNPRMYKLLEKEEVGIIKNETMDKIVYTLDLLTLSREANANANDISYNFSATCNHLKEELKKYYPEVMEFAYKTSYKIGEITISKENLKALVFVETILELVKQVSMNKEHLIGDSIKLLFEKAFLILSLNDNLIEHPKEKSKNKI